MYKNKKIYVAPMMQYTDKHDRYFLRIISKNVILFTEMIPANAIIYGNKKKLLEYNQMNIRLYSKLVEVIQKIFLNAL